MAGVSSFISSPGNTASSLKLCLFAKNGCRHAWTDHKLLMVWSHPWSLPSAAHSHALSIALAQMLGANVGRGEKHQKSPFRHIFCLPHCSCFHLSPQTLHSQKTVKVPTPTTTNLFQETPYLSASVGETPKKARGGAGWHLHATFWTITSLKPVLGVQTHSWSMFPLASRLSTSQDPPTPPNKARDHSLLFV